MFGLFSKKEQKLFAPVNGVVVPLSNVPDEAIAQKMIGDGCAVEPSDKIICAPCDGKVSMIFPTNHAFGIETPSGLEILVHIGVDTVNLNGEGFKRLCDEQKEVTAGTPIIEVDLDFLKEKGVPSITAVMITNMDEIKNIDVQEGSCKKGDPMLTVKTK